MCEFTLWIFRCSFFYYYRGRSQWLQITVTAAQQVSSARCGEGNVPFCQLCEEFCILFCQLVFKNLSLFWPGGTKPDTKHSPLLHCHCDSCFFFFFCNCYDSGALALSQLSEGVKTGWKCHRAEQPLITAKVGLTKHLKEQLKKSFFFFFCKFICFEWVTPRLGFKCFVRDFVSSFCFCISAWQRFRPGVPGDSGFNSVSSPVIDECAGSQWGRWGESFCISYIHLGQITSHWEDL